MRRPAGSCRSCRTLAVMSEPLPEFKYHPEPLRTGSLEARPFTCACCGRRREYVYVAPVYCERDLHESLCPWCIADGSAAAKFGASFADDHPLRKAGVPVSVVEDVSQRTPGYSSWQQEEWLTHCNDACEFHGDATVEQMRNVSEATKAAWCQHYGMSEADWNHLTRDYVPRGDQAFYRFVCRHCHAVLLGWDCS
jgi:uncharacterized protein